MRDTVEVKIIDCPGRIPNVFTPNQDNRNDTFFIENIERHDWSIHIVDRWGNRVYQNARYRNDWTGAGLTPGIYYYSLYSASLQKRIKGWVHLIQ